MDKFDERVERVKHLIPKKIKKLFVFDESGVFQKTKMPKDVDECYQVERGAFLAISRIKNLREIGDDERWVVGCLKLVISNSRAHARSPGMVFYTIRNDQYVNSLKKRDRELLSEAFNEAEIQERIFREENNIISKEDEERRRENRKKYGPLAGGRASGRTKHREGSVRTVQGGAPGLGKRS